MRSSRFLFILFLTILFSLIKPREISIKGIDKNYYPRYRLVLDPGHGGLSISPKQKHGDRYDAISGRYLSFYQDGVQYKNFEESIIVYSIAEKVKSLLDLTLNDDGFKRFKEIIAKYSKEEPQRAIIDVYLSRGKSLNNNNSTGGDDNTGGDVNGPFRLFDYVYNGKKIPGRISRINDYRPHLIVSLHCDFQAPVYFRGINPVIAAPNSLLSKGLEYLKGETKDRRFFFNSKYSDWFAESVKRSGFKWFLKDTYVYFTGFPLDKNLRVLENKFMGYRQNMVTWSYNDPEGWEKKAAGHPEGSQYAKKTGGFKPKGRFWDRERSDFEKYRREGGIEGYGGDNLYASAEIIRFILYSLHNTGLQKDYNLGKPYISVWSLPILVNAVTAYIELGYLKRKKDRYLLTARQDEVAEGIAVGIYSLFTGINPAVKPEKDAPRGLNIDFNKYLQSGKSYFDEVMP